MFCACLVMCLLPPLLEWRRGYFTWIRRNCHGNTGGAGCHHCTGNASVSALNELLHQYGSYMVGRMGVPYRSRGVNIISVAMDAPADVISALSGKIGKLPGITAKTVYAPEDALS